MELDPEGADTNKCETDFVLLSQSNEDKAQIVLAECKSVKDEISKDDVNNLTQVANAFPSEYFDVFIVFAKLSPFSHDEIERCKLAQDEYRNRVIMLTDRELESPHFVYERTKKEFLIDAAVISLEGMAKNTVDIFFTPRPIRLTNGS